jgi:hypothetical protein
MNGPPFEESLDDEERAPPARTDVPSGEGAVPSEVFPDMPTSRGPALEEDQEEGPPEITGEP